MALDEINKIVEEAFDRSDKIIAPFQERIRVLEKRLRVADDICAMMENYIRYYDCDYCIFSIDAKDETTHETDCELKTQFDTWNQLKTENP